MHFAAMLPEDAPDPRLEQAARIRDLPFEVLGLVPQPHLEDWGSIGMTEGHNAGRPFQQSVSIGYTFWRNPGDRDDPANLAELDAETRASLAVEPPWPRPAWLVEFARRMRYPQLGEAVRTTWNRDHNEHTTLPRQLVDHTNHILLNRFREELALPPGSAAAGGWSATAASVNPRVSLRVNGAEMPAVEIDTAPFVYAIGVSLGPDLVATVVVPREFLPSVRLELATRAAGAEPKPRI